ncbi:hypothetical protein MNBD_GAMMA17-486 [hydrothermal vent metagenome]|uniref:tRNA/rRNA methyltransferase SpoU type domain-containing protein n=1 Tax=hydrothermal vent metagenome TaxID=652676 RepID=A0A3B0ZT74_9ZZZZ
MKNSNRQFIHQDHDLNRVQFPLVLLLDDISDPANVGAIFRLADALGVARLMLCGDTVRPPNRRLSRTSRSTDKVVSYERFDVPDGAVVSLREQGYRLVALELAAQSVDLQTLDYGEMGKICLILGGEQSGVSPSLLEIADHTVHIQMSGLNSSMNVATACAIAVYEMTRHLERGAVGRPGLNNRIEGWDEKAQK